MLSALLCKLQTEGQLEGIERLEGEKSNRNSCQKLLSNAGMSGIYQTATPVIALLASRPVHGLLRQRP
jgi:hypothetical protein